MVFHDGTEREVKTGGGGAPERVLPKRRERVAGRGGKGKEWTLRKKRRERELVYDIQHWGGDRDRDKAKGGEDTKSEKMYVHTEPTPDGEKKKS